MKNTLNKKAQIAVKNLGVSIIDTFTLGIGSGIKDTLQQIKEYSELCNDALYTLQIKTFLESIELDQIEIQNFFDNNKDNQRLGLEVLKILESTYLEKQASMLAVIFTKYVNGTLDKSKFNKYVNLIKKIDNHLWGVLVEDLKYAERLKKQGYADCELPIDRNAIFSIGYFKNTRVSSENDLRVIGLIKDEFKEAQLTFSGSNKPESESIRTDFYLDFYFDIFRNINQS